MSKKLLTTLAVCLLSAGTALAQGSPDSHEALDAAALKAALEQVAQLTPEQAVVLTPTYRPAVWGGLNRWKVSTSTRDGHPLLVLEQSGARIWHADLDLPVDTARYPIVVLVYRAQSLSNYGLSALQFAGNGSREGGITVAYESTFIADGQAHELRLDLRNRGSNVRLIEGVNISLFRPWTKAGAVEPPTTEFELISLRLEADAETPPPAVGKGKPVTVRVVGQDDQPMAGARVTLDRERANWSVTGLTDGHGQVSLTPRQTEPNQHALEISRDGYATEQVTLKAGEAASEKIILRKADKSVAGHVVRPDGAALEGADVVAYARGQWRSWARSDKTGAFTISGLADEPVELKVDMKLYVNGTEGDEPVTLAAGGGSYYIADGSATCRSGDSDVKITLREWDHDRQAGGPAQLASRTGDLTLVGLADQQPAAKGMHVVLCFWDGQNRSAKHALKMLAERAENWKAKKVVVFTVLTDASAADSAAAWMKDNGINLPLGVLPADKVGLLEQWNIRGNPWILYQRPNGSVSGSGLSVEDLQDKIDKQ